MTMNGMNMAGEWLSVVVGGFALMLFGVLLAINVKHTNKPAGRRGHRQASDRGTDEPVTSDGLIDSFAGIVEEAGGSLPPLVTAALIIIPLWWLLYMIINWSPALVNIITINKASFNP